MWVPMAGLDTPWCALSGACREGFRDKQGLGNITKGFYTNQGLFSPHHFNWKSSVEFLFLSFFLFFFSFSYGLTVINSTTKLSCEQVNRPILRSFVFFLGPSQSEGRWEQRRTPAPRRASWFPIGPENLLGGENSRSFSSSKAVSLALALTLSSEFRCISV